MSKFLFLPVILFLLSACGIEDAEPKKSSELIIASDFLTTKDTLLFSSFSKAKNIRVRIRFLSSDSIQKRLKLDGYNSDFDLVFVKSLVSVKNLKSINFHHLSKENIRTSLFNFSAFQNNSWFAVGHDPYVFSYVPDTLDLPTSYSDLTKKFNYSCLNPDENKVLLANIKYLTKKKPSYYSKWKKAFERNYLPFNAGTDSLPSKQFMLVKWSQYVEHPFFKKNRKRTVNYSLTNSALYADRKSIAIVLEAKNFKNAILFLTFLNSKTKSAYFYEKMGAIPMLTKGSSYDDEKISGMRILSIHEDSLLMNL
jgi:ABC-type Fe3+ transport system substrate-binding protein